MTWPKVGDRVLLTSNLNLSTTWLGLTGVVIEQGDENYGYKVYIQPDTIRDDTKDTHPFWWPADHLEVISEPTEEEIRETIASIVRKKDD